jgi:hypothetical protein
VLVHALLADGREVTRLVVSSHLHTLVLSTLVALSLLGGAA